MTIEQFMPPTTLAALAILFSALRFQNQRWNQAIGNGMRGASRLWPLINFYVATSGFVAKLFAIFVLGVVFWAESWQEALGLFAFSFAFGFTASNLVVWMFNGDWYFLPWLLATLGLWPVGFLLYQKTATLYF